MMMKKCFAILEAEEVVNIAVSESPLSEVWVDVTDLDPRPSVGWSYIDGTFYAPAQPDAPEPVVEYTAQNEVPTVAGQPLQGLNNTYYAPANVEIQLTADIVDGDGVVQTQLDQTALGYPPVLKMPVVKFAGGINGTVVDEVYFTVTLVEGVLTATGTLPSSGDWKLLTERLNASLQAIGADWKVERPNTTFLV